MNVNIYRYEGDNRVADKSNGITLLGNYSATYLKEPESLRSINLRIQYTTPEERNTLLNSNYAYITELNRYYYIRPESIIDLGGIITLSLEEDDIMTNLSEVLQLVCVVERQENEFNTYLPDNQYKVYGYSRIQTFPLPNGFNNHGYEKFILAIAGAV